VNYFVRLWRRFQTENFGQLAASLSFTTLLSLVPLVTVMITLSASLPLVSGLMAQLDAFFIENLLPAKSGGAIARYMLEFSLKASRLTWAGLLVLLVTAYLLLFSIERAFNHLWQIPKPRPLLQRLWRYAVVLAIGPVVAGALLVTTTQGLSLSLGFFNETAGFRRQMSKVLAFFLVCGFFTFLYYAVPAARVRLGHAAVGGILAGAAIVGLQRLFEAYLQFFPSYGKIYGAFAVVPIFLIWLYLCWVVALFCALVVANFSHHPYARRAGRPRTVQASKAR
jgi:membrane protein